MTRPTLIYDGDCSFCRMWVEFWRGLTGDRIDYRTADGAIDAVEYADGETRCSGAEAVFELLSGVSGYGWLLWMHRNVPGFAALAGLCYRFIAGHRNAAYRVTRALWGERVEPASYRVACGIFVRILALIYMVAFASFGIQARGLVGSEGILPIRQYFQIAYSALGNAALWRVPSIFWWAQGDFALLSIAWGGVAMAAVATIARPFSGWQRGVFAILCVYYLSIVSAGQIFMSYQWDLLLVEAGFLAIFLRPSRIRVWLFRWLLFRLMFESGMVKLTSHDPAWRNLTALSYHYWTQPLPTIFGWFAAKLPLWFDMASTAMVFAIELVLPFLMFGPRRLKQVAGFGFLALQLLIFLTGNYTFFNLLAMALCLFLFDDAFFARWARKKKRAAPAALAESKRWLSAALFVFVMTVSGVELAGMLGAQLPLADQVLELEGPFGLVNQYGLFAVMTTSRPEIQIEGSNDGTHWDPYVFRYKAGPLDRAPGWVAPFQPRLDWQMWFAALGSYRQNPWFVRFLLQLLEGSKPVLALIERDPFGGTPPLHVRAMVYEYRFSSFEDLRKTGNWWTRELKGMYFPPVSLRGRGNQGQ
ncbi:MAG: lipase maturation factor family protein [Acidobacteriota bacterium]|nr:lipase maturation factor family protein [Acidobacteriota bacterium]